MIISAFNHSMCKDALTMQICMPEEQKAQTGPHFQCIQTVMKMISIILIHNHAIVFYATVK